MAELTLDTGDITAVLRKNLEGWNPSLESETMGYVTSVGDGVARVAGLPNAMASELLEFPGGSARCCAEPRRGLHWYRHHG